MSLIWRENGKPITDPKVLEEIAYAEDGDDLPLRLDSRRRMLRQGMPEDEVNRALGLTPDKAHG